jgi:hypothetical protein
VWVIFRREGGRAYTSQGERPSVDLVRQLLMSCGMSCTVHKIAPVVMGDKIMVYGLTVSRTYGSKYVLGQCVHGH